MPAFFPRNGAGSAAFRAFRDAIRKSLAFRAAPRSRLTFAFRGVCCESGGRAFAFWKIFAS
jgi:hypothetical protein